MKEFYRDSTKEPTIGDALRSTATGRKAQSEAGGKEEEEQMTDFELFIELVRMMRTRQREYFRFRTDADLRECKRWEQEVDKRIAELDRRETRESQERQPNLFN